MLRLCHFKLMLKIISTDLPIKSRVLVNRSCPWIPNLKILLDVNDLLDADVEPGRRIISLIVFRAVIFAGTILSA